MNDTEGKLGHEKKYASGLDDARLLTTAGYGPVASLRRRVTAIVAFISVICSLSLIAIRFMPAQAPATPLAYVFPFDSKSSISQALHINATIGYGAVQTFEIDTGSTGIVVSQRFIGKHHIPLGPRFCLEYSSSKNNYTGEWVMAEVVLSSGAVEATTEWMPVRMVTRYCSGTGKCTTDPQLINVTMMGVGFDRGTVNGNGKDPCGCRTFLGINPFLRLKEMVFGGSMVPGFIISPSTKTLTLGITADNSQGFDFLQLERGPGDWIAPMVDVAVPTGNFSSFNASLLVDTGLSYSIVQAPTTAEPKQTTKAGRKQVEDGQIIVLNNPSIARPVYQFEVNKSDAPAWVSWRHHEHEGVPFINTGRFALTQFDYLYDEKSGRLGFKFMKGWRARRVEAE